MQRREFLKALAAIALAPLVPSFARAQAALPPAMAAKPRTPPKRTGDRDGKAGSARGTAGKPGRKAVPRKPDKIQKIESDARGTTLTLKLDNGPFPCPGFPYQDNTTMVFIPSFYRRRGRTDVVVHFHGHSNTCGDAMRGMQLREQFFDSKQNGILVMPQGPVRAADSSGGKLEKPGGLRRFLAEVLGVLGTLPARKALKNGAPAAQLGRVFLSAHSGGYKVTARCLAAGGVAGIAEAWLFDALYGEVAVFRDWILKKGVSRKLVSLYTDAGGTRGNNERLIGELKKAKLRVSVEKNEGELTRAQLHNGRAIFIHTALNHSGTTFRMNNFRDLLFASSLDKAVDHNWYAEKNKKRKLEKRR